MFAVDCVVPFDLLVYAVDCGDLNCDPVAVFYWLPGLLRPNLISRSGIKQDSTEIKNKNK